MLWRKGVRPEGRTARVLCRVVNIFSFVTMQYAVGIGLLYFVALFCSFFYLCANNVVLMSYVECSYISCMFDIFFTFFATIALSVCISVIFVCCAVLW